MCKKSVILGLVLLLAGAVMLGWIFTEQKREKKRQEERQEKLKTKLSKLDEMIGDEIDIRHFNNVVYDEDHQQESAKYKRREETRGLILTVSGMFMLSGGAILSWLLLLGMARLLIRGSSHLYKFSTDFLRSRKKAKDKQLTEAKVDGKETEQEQKPHEHQNGSCGEVEKHSKVAVNSGWENFNKNYTNRHKPASSQTATSKRDKSSAEKRAAKPGESAVGTQKLAVLLSDEESVEFEEPLKVEAKGLNLKTSLSHSCENSVGLEDSLNAQSEYLEKQMAEFKRMAGSPFCDLLQNAEPPHSVQPSSLEHSKPVEDSIRELTQQVSAIREYAAHQQERVKKLQEGYDWNIIRNFCLRVIRCIDNLENRINRLSKQDIDTTDLEEVRDELVFALESNGVEQFEPEIDSDYRGQEKNTEAVKDKEDSDNPDMTGKIAKVVRPGYQYFVDEENVKIVRTAQVRLFG